MPAQKLKKSDFWAKTQNLVKSPKSCPNSLPAKGKICAYISRLATGTKRAMLNKIGGGVAK